MKFKHIVFDWDGTLADTYPVILASYDYVFDKLGVSRIPYDEVRKLTSTLQNKDTFGYIFGDKKQEAINAFYEYATKHHLDNLRTMPDAKKLLDYCQNEGAKIYLVTSKNTPFVYAEMDKLGFKNYFKKIVAAGEYAQDKPSPVATHEVFDKKIPPADTIVVIGDGSADVKTARTYDHDGKKAVCILYDPNDKYNGSVSPDYKIKNLADAITILKGKNNV